MSELKYPIFLECIKLTDDVYWKNILENLSFGISPSNTFFRQDQLVSKQKGKEFNFKIEPEKGPEYIFENVYNLLHNTLGLMSDIQIKEEETNFDNQNKKKKVISSLVDEFCNRMKKQHKLSMESIRELQRYIHLNIILKTEMLDCINYNDDGTIDSIDGIFFSEGGLGTTHFQPEKCQYDYLTGEEFMFSNLR